MKKIAIILTILMLGCAAVSAAPLTNYDFGHASFDIGLTLPCTVGQPNPNPGPGCLALLPESSMAQLSAWVPGWQSASTTTKFTDHWDPR
ncbi:MAG: hypothetical protein WCV63_05360 [Negativicutes bacterium]|jgi:hypothetical protein